MMPDALPSARQIFAVLEEVFAAMVDPEPGLLVPLDGPADLVEPVHASVVVRSGPPVRVAVVAGASTATNLARALLCLEPGEPVSEDDVVDAFGEIANVVGGNLVSLALAGEVLTLPRVRREKPPAQDASRCREVAVAWRGQPLGITVGQM